MSRPATQSSLDDANKIIEEQLDNQIEKLEKKLSGDVLTYKGNIIQPASDLIRDAIESKNKKREKLVVVLETSGGYIEVAQRIAETFHHHYRVVEFIIPNFAMSAGTVLVMSGYAFFMDYYSVLGPIDPQILRPNGMWIPALGYLEQYNRFIERSKKGLLSTAEMAFLIQKFDPAELYRYEQERELSISLLKEWLVKYKFKNWVRTKTHNKVVTQGMKSRRASQVAKILNDTERWHSHGRGISMDVLRNDVKLQIEDFGNDPDLNAKIRSYYKLLTDYMMRRNQDIVLHILNRYTGFGST